MENVKNLNKEVTVSALYFRKNQNFKSFPKRIQYDGQEVTFIESGIQYLVQQGQKVIRLFDMTDGQMDYRLKFDPEQFTWTLVRATQTPRAVY